MPRSCTIGAVTIGAGHPLAIIAGPCTLESRDLGLDVAARLAEWCADANLPYVFKASLDKANRSSADSPRGPGIERGLDWLADIKERCAVPVTTDIHLPEHAALVASVVDCLQIPAFLCRQSDLLTAAAHAARQHDRAVNVKKGQFLAPTEMRHPVRKLAEAGCTNVLLTERGTFFGYHRLVNDFLGLGDLMHMDSPDTVPVCFDVTHSTQTPGSAEQTGGRPERAPLLARAATAAGVNALFIECHPTPSTAVSDAATQLPLATMKSLLLQVAAIRDALTWER
jgi:2-dehydro-3-deoxyphosphooctonate aldolase (KDO 8-P synthase)